jgi:hypothetical protein
MRAAGWTLADIAAELGVARSSVALRVRDVQFAAQPRRRAPPARTKCLAAEEGGRDPSVACRRQGANRAIKREGVPCRRRRPVCREGSKADRKVVFANTDSRMVAFFCAWLRRFFSVDEDRLRVRVYLHQGLDLNAAEQHWSEVTKIPLSQFGRPYRAASDSTIRATKHEFGCAYVTYSCSLTHRSIMGLIAALLSSESHSGVAQPAEHATVNRVVEGSSPSPGASLGERDGWA